MAEHVDAEQPDLSTIEPHSGEQLQLDSLMDTHGINEQALEDEAGINTGQSESQHSSAPVTTVSADLLPEHIIEGKRIRKPTDRKAVCHTTASTHTFAAYLRAFNVKSGLNKRIHRSDLPPPPKSWKEMLNHPFSQYFTIACGMEYTKIEERETFEIVDMPYGHFILPVMWVFEYKFDDDGYLLKFKSRLVARGDKMPPSDKRTRSDTLAARSARALLAIMAAFDLDARHLDGVNAFLNSKLDPDEQIYCYLPDGYKQSGKVAKLLRALYGLPRSPYLWFNELSTTLKGLGFKPVLEEKCILTNGRIILFFYVDDIVILSPKEYRKEADEIVRKLMEKYEIRDLGDLTWFLNMRVTRDRPNRKVWITLDAYIDKIVKQFNLSDGPKVLTPLATGVDLFHPYEGKATREEIEAYQTRVGCLIYPGSRTRPDIAEASNLLARFMQNPSPIHVQQADRVICYLRDTKDLSIQYCGYADSEVTTKVGITQRKYLRHHPTLHMEMIWRHAAAQKDMCSNYREAPLIGANSSTYCHHLHYRS